MARSEQPEYVIRIPLNMIQLTERNGKAWPLSFGWTDAQGAKIRVDVEKVIAVVPFAEQKSGAVGDRYECIINGQTEYLFFTIRQPRKWFKLKEVTEAEYKQYYPIPGE